MTFRPNRAASPALPLAGRQAVLDAPGRDPDAGRRTPVPQSEARAYRTFAAAFVGSNGPAVTEYLGAVVAIPFRAHRRRDPARLRPSPQNSFGLVEQFREAGIDPIRHSDLPPDAAALSFPFFHI